MLTVFLKAKSKNFSDEKQCLLVPLKNTLSLNDLNAKKPQKICTSYGKLFQVNLFEQNIS